MNAVVPPPGFDGPFLDWLGQMCEVLWVQFAPAGEFSQANIELLEQQIGHPLPSDLLRFYARYNPWGVLADWTSWEPTKGVIARALNVPAPLAPVNCSGYQSGCLDTVAVIYGPEEYEVVERWRATGRVRRYSNLRCYFIDCVVTEELLSDQGSPA
jgi:hypothetical protein